MIRLYIDVAYVMLLAYFTSMLAYTRVCVSNISSSFILKVAITDMTGWKTFTTKLDADGQERSRKDRVGQGCYKY